MYKACFYVTERADNALSHWLLVPSGDMGTDDFVFTQRAFIAAKCFELEAHLMKKLIILGAVSPPEAFTTKDNFRWTK